MPTVEEAIREGAALLTRSGIGQERQTAGVLLAASLGLDRAQLLARSDEEIGRSRYLRFLSFVERRASGEPLQYITGLQEFYGLDFYVAPGALIPRPETEFLIERVIELAGQTSYESGPLIVDAGTGSGCIAVTLAVEIPGARVIAIDISNEALDIARQNAGRHNVASRIEFLRGDLLDPLEGGLKERVDFIASNPPYVPLTDAESLQREVRDWEPATALFGGEDGLDFYRRLLAEGSGCLKPGGYLVFEMGFGQLEPIKKMIDTSRWEIAAITGDLQGIPRTLALRNRPEIPNLRSVPTVERS